MEKYFKRMNPDMPMMDAGRIVFDVKGAARSKMTVDDLLEKFRENAGKALDNDRILLSKVEAGN